MTAMKQGRAIGLPAASIEMQGTTPYACDYGDVYYSTDNGLAESRHVFIEGNNLPERFAAWRAKKPFTIAETGFGTGLNMLLAWQTFCEVAPAGARLHLVSIEARPPSMEDLSALWANSHALRPHGQRLIECWPTPMRGSHRLRLDDRVTLDLILDDVESALNTFDGYAHAWFLDGFSPARNPAMWSQSVFHQVAASSQPGASLATYTCARAVREHAKSAGFEWHKRQGIGRKREVLCGRLGQARADAPSIPPSRKHRPWFTPPPVHDTGAIAVIGAGISGASVAEALARRDQPCDVYDAHGGPGGASGNAQGALHVRPSADGDTRTQFYLAALAYTQRWLATIDPTRSLWSDCGLLQLACNVQETRRQQRCMENLAPPASLFQQVEAHSAARLAGISLAPDVQGGLYFPHAGWVSPVALCRRLLDDSHANLQPTAVNTLRHNGETWQLACANGQTAEYTHVVLACAQQAAQLCPDLPPMEAVRGQLSAFTPPDSGLDPACVVCGDGYVMPAYRHQLHAGASFTRDSDAITPHRTDDQANREAVAAFAPTLASRLNGPTESRVAFRCGSYDRLPFIGPVPAARAWRRIYGQLALDARRIPAVPGPYRPNLWASLAHGANGLVSAPLAAEILVSRMLGEPMPLSTTTLDALHPGRWLIRELIRGRSLHAGAHLDSISR